jgi:hypothetical protein
MAAGTCRCPRQDGGGMMRHYPPEIVPRDDNMFDVVSGCEVAGPFPTLAFALQIASGHPPTPAAQIAKFRSFKLRRSRDAACAA